MSDLIYPLYIRNKTICITITLATNTLDIIFPFTACLSSNRIPITIPNVPPRIETIVTIVSISKSGVK